MPFFQNVFDSEFRGNLLLADRQYSLNFNVRSNLPNSSQAMTSWNPEFYDVSSNSTLTLKYSFDSGRTWTSLAVNVSTGAVNTSAATALEVATALNNNATFAALFTASMNNDNKPAPNNYVIIKSRRPRTGFKVYVVNGGAEIALRFNKKAGVAELPTYFSRHTIANVTTFTDSVGMLIQLDPDNSTNPSGYLVDRQIITEAGLNYAVVQADWQLLKGRSGLFQFQKISVDGSDRITEVIEYSAGATVGDLSKKIIYTYTGSNTNPSTIVELPYVITNSDLVTP